MMNYASLALLGALILSGGSAHAQVLNGNAGVGISGDASVSNTSASTDVNVDANASSDSLNTETEDTSVAEEGTNEGSDGIFNILRSDIDASTKYSVTQASSVRTSASLESYAAATVQSDERLTSVEMSENGLEMAYRKEAKFLWVIPASLTARVSVDQQGDVTVRYPWYSFLMSTNQSTSDLEALIQSEVTEINDSLDVSGSAGVSATTSTRVQRDATIRRWARTIEAVYLAVSSDTRAEVAS